MNILKLDLEHLLSVFLNFVLHIFALEHETELFKGAALSLGENHVNRQNLYQNPHTVDNIVLPSDRVERDWVDVGIEENGKADGKLLDGDSLCSKRDVSFKAWKDRKNGANPE